MWARQERENQKILNAGQRDYRAVQCPKCMMVYHVKDPEDELFHAGIRELVQDALTYSVTKRPFVHVFQFLIFFSVCYVELEKRKSCVPFQFRWIHPCCSSWLLCSLLEESRKCFAQGS